MLKLVLSVVAVVILAGGGYFFFAPNAKDLNLMQYIPESIASYLPIATETEVAELSTEPFLDGSDDQAQEISSQVGKNNNELQNDEVQSDAILEISEDSAIEETIVNSDPVVDNTVEVMTKVETGDNKQVTDLDNKKVVVHKAQTQEIAKKPPEVIKLENKLVDMNSSISKLDDENERLQQKFKEMLKKNKDLAVTLSQIEKKLKSSN